MNQTALARIDREVAQAEAKLMRDIHEALEASLKVFGSPTKNRKLARAIVAQWRRKDPRR